MSINWGNCFARGTFNAFNILSGALLSRGMQRSSLTPFDTLYVDLDSPSGFSSWVHPSYATPLNVSLAASGFDTSFAPLTSAISNTVRSTFSGVDCCCNNFGLIC